MKKVLIIEDDAWLAEQYAHALKDFEVHYAPNAVSAMDMLDDTKPDVLLVDVLLPGGAIFTLLHELQSYTDTRKLPVVMCSNIADTLSLDDLRPYGVMRLLDKTTIEPGDVVAAVRAVLV